MKKTGDQSTKKLNPLNEVLLTCRLMFKYALFFGFLVNILMLATPIYSMQVLDRVISSSNTDTLLMLTIVIGSALLLLSLIQVARTMAMNQLGNWFEKQLSTKLLSNAVRTSLISRSGGGSQQLRDLQSIKTFLTSPSLISILDVPWALIFVIVLFIIHPYMGVLTVVGGIILIALAIASDKLTKPLHDSSNEGFLLSMRQVDQTTRNAEVVSVMGLLPQITKNWQQINTKVQTAQNLVSGRQNILSETTKFLRLLIQILVTGLGAYLVLQHEMSVGAIIACSSISGRALAPFEQAIMSWKGYLNFRQSHARLSELIDKYYTDEVRMSLPRPNGAISAENIVYAPPSAPKPIIKGISLNLKPGEMLAIIGPSGSGKTTLAKVISGAWKPQSGSIRIDGSNINDWNRDELGQYLGYLPQDVELFSGSVRENIGRMNRDANSDMVVEAATIAGAHEMILQLPKGYDTEIGYDGAVLSGGQRQRVGLARAFFGDPKIMILDEPNANLDAMGEAALAQALIQAKERGITTIIISHRPSVLTIVDKILVMKDGVAALYGAKDEVLEKMNQANAAAKAVVVDFNKKAH